MRRHAAWVASGKKPLKHLVDFGAHNEWSSLTGRTPANGTPLSALTDTINSVSVAQGTGSKQPAYGSNKITYASANNQALVQRASTTGALINPNQDFALVVHWFPKNLAVVTGCAISVAGPSFGNVKLHWNQNTTTLEVARIDDFLSHTASVTKVVASQKHTAIARVRYAAPALEVWDSVNQAIAGVAADIGGTIGTTSMQVGIGAAINSASNEGEYLEGDFYHAGIFGPAATITTATGAAFTTEALAIHAALLALHP